MKTIALVIILALCPALLVHADGNENENEQKVAVRMNRVKHPVTKKWGYAFKEQNIKSKSFDLLFVIIAMVLLWIGSQK